VLKYRIKNETTVPGVTIVDAHSRMLYPNIKMNNMNPDVTCSYNFAHKEGNITMQDQTCRRPLAGTGT
jgi:hypothetical protein